MAARTPTERGGARRLITIDRDGLEGDGADTSLSAKREAARVRVVAVEVMCLRWRARGITTPIPSVSDSKR
ncbi:hypothetical protein C9J85_05590 [Haloferax sp. wsp5]|nr:hypothetical protein C9J85_05590 [Haloferax sp. wsp5]